MISTKHVVLGLDFGGTKLAAGLIDLTSATLLKAAQIPTPADKGAPQVVADMITLAQNLVGNTRLAGIGVSFGGHVRRNEVMHSLHVKGWSQYPLQEQLREKFEVNEIKVANDANAIALGEWRFGAGKGTHSLLYVTVSTGIGGGIVVGGHLLEGAKGMAGEIGHMKMDPEGPLCTCGSRGCLEAMAAGPAIVRDANTLLENQPTMQSVLRDEQNLTAKIIAQCAQQGDAVATQALENAARTLGRAIANSIILLDVERVVIGGGISRAGRIWWHTVTDTVNAIVLPWNKPVDIQHSGLGEYEGVWGAAALLPVMFC